VQFFAEIFAKAFDFWHVYLSPALPAACRHEPSCSQYASQALRLHGLVRGLGLAVHRLARCHPWGTSGFDPVPGVMEETRS
jgi:putative membrane protein insertion efficiency factor